MQKTLLLTQNHICYTFIQPKFWAVMLMILSANYIKVQPISQIIFRYNIPVSFGIFALIFSEPFFLIVLSIALLFIFSELPFKNSQQIFLVTRSGKRIWCVSQILYIVLISLFVLLAVLLETALICGGKISFDNSSWGKIIMSIYNTGLGSEYMIGFCGNASYESIVAETPLSALIYTLTTELLLSVTTGLAVFAINLTTHSTFGIIIGGIPIALNLFMSYFDSIPFIRLSPFSWVHLRAMLWLPFKQYPALILGTASAAAVTLALIKCRKRADIL